MSYASCPQVARQFCYVLTWNQATDKLRQDIPKVLGSLQMTLESKHTEYTTWFASSKRYIHTQKATLEAQLKFLILWNRRKRTNLPRKLCRKNINRRTYYTFTLHIIMIGISERVIPDNQNKSFRRMESEKVMKNMRW